MPMRGIRGATTAAANTRAAILDAANELLRELLKANAVRVDDIASVIFTVTPDLDAAFPASAARALGWRDVALLDMLAPRVPNDLPYCIRVLIHCDTARAANQLRHIYLRDARQLRPDRAEEIER